MVKGKIARTLAIFTLISAPIILTNPGKAYAHISDVAIASAARQAGFPSGQIATAVAVALGESSGRPDAHNTRDPYGGSYGLWQINGSHRTLLASGNWRVPADNARMAYRIWYAYSSWRPWGAFNNGSYQKYLARGRAAAGVPTSPNPSVPTVTTRPYPSQYGSLSGIARAVCGASDYWYKIWKANSFITNPNVIKPGVKLRVPCSIKVPTASTALKPSTGWVAPVPGALSCRSGLGWHAQRTGHLHQGLDLLRSRGTTIRSIHSGTVTRIKRNYGIGSGLYVVVDHGRYNSVYMHMQSEIVSVGQRVRAGQTIGYVGNSGTSAYHLHFEIHDGSWRPINPIKFLRNVGLRISGGSPTYQCG